MITTEMPAITECSVEGCGYNEHQGCHAYAITIEKMDSSCSTFIPLPAHGGLDMLVAKVGACQRAECVHNADLICTAEGVRIGAGGGTAHCLTFEAR